MDLSRAKFLLFARRIALVTGTVTPALAACAGSTSSGGATAPVASASNQGVSATDAAVAEPPPQDVTSGTGPCRCSWDTNGAAAPRVCKKGEINYAGARCVPGTGPSYGEGYGPVMKGPLPPPDLPSDVGDYGLVPS